MQRRTFTIATAATLAAPMVRAQNLPSGPVRVIVGFAPGGGTDILARVIGQKLAEMWKTQVIVENRAGASGTIAADFVAKGPTDGSVLLMAHINSQAITPALQKVNYDAAKDFQPIVLVGVTPNLLICNENQPAKNVAALVDLCRANPGKVSFGSAGTGSAQHLALEMFMLAAKVKAIHVPYKGSGPMLTDLIGGTIQYSFDTMTAATPHVKGGKAIALAQTRLQRKCQGLRQRADHGRVGLPRLSRPPPGTAWWARQDAGGHGQAHERRREQGAADARRDGTAGRLGRRGWRRLDREVRRIHEGGIGEVGQGHQGWQRESRDLTPA
jgi:tripartite-type tricarboxylate transporter receptor subunit TctC